MPQLKLNKNILIGRFIYDYHNGNNYILYEKYNIKINNNHKIIFDDYILKLNLNKLKGKIIMKELVEKVFHPERLFNISNKYDIDFIDLIDIYS